MIQFAEVVKINRGTATVRLSGYDADVAIDLVLLQPGGGSSVKTWVPPAAGDVVAVLVNSERLEDSVVLGGVYTDSQTPPKSGDVIALQAQYIYIGDSMDGIQKASRDDHVQAELSAIKTALDALTADYNAHVHTVPALAVVSAAGAPLGSTVPGSTATGLPQHAQGYTVGATAADSVFIK